MPLSALALVITAAALHAGWNLIGSHEATVAQLLLVVRGSGEVTGSESQPARVGPGCAVFWRGGETHETRAHEDGLTAVVIEGEHLDPEKVMKLKAGV